MTCICHAAIPDDRTLCENCAHRLDKAARASNDLRNIIDNANALETQAVHQANSGLMPGGKPMVALADVANLEAFNNKMSRAEQEWIDGGSVGEDPWTVHDDDWEPPLQALLFWSEQWRQQLGMDYDMKPTLVTEANFLRNPDVLRWAAANVPDFDNFVREVRVVHRALENLVHAGRRLQRTDVPCAEECAENPPQLVVVHKWGDGDKGPDGSTPLRPAVDRGDEDGWRCPKCWTFYDAARFYTLQRAIEEQNDAWVPISLAATRLHRHVSHVKRWVDEGLIEARRVNGIRHVSWADARAIHQNTPTRNRAG